MPNPRPYFRSGGKLSFNTKPEAASEVTGPLRLVKEILRLRFSDSLAIQSESSCRDLMRGSWSRYINTWRLAIPVFCFGKYLKASKSLTSYSYKWIGRDALEGNVTPIIVNENDFFTWQRRNLAPFATSRSGGSGLGLCCSPSREGQSLRATNISYSIPKKHP